MKNNPDSLYVTCPRCGAQFQGNTCPKCDSPAILVNAADYERRKAEWERQQKENSDKQDKQQKSRENVRKIADDILNTDYRSMVRQSGIFDRIKRHRRAAVSIMVSAVLLVAAIIVLVNFMPGRHIRLYIGDGKLIYMGSLADASVASADAVIYNYDRSHAYQRQQPAELDRLNHMDEMCSDNGKYYAMVVYQEVGSASGSGDIHGVSGTSHGLTADSDVNVQGESNSIAVNGNAISDGTYIIYVWDNKKNIRVAAQGTGQKTIRYVSDDGLVVYTDTHYLNEGAISGTDLYSATVEGTEAASLLTQNMSELIVMQKGRKLIWLDAEGKLYIADTSGGHNSITQIADNVRESYAEVSESFYVNAVYTVCNNEAEEVVYGTDDGEYICVNVTDRQSGNKRYLFTLDEPAEAVIYEAKYGCAYAAAGQDLYRIVKIPVKDWDKDNFRRELSRADSIESGNSILYMAEDNSVVYVNGSHELKSIKHGKKNTFTEKLLNSDIAEGTFRRVGGNEEAYRYVAGTNLCYGSAATSKVTVLKENITQSYIGQTVYYRSRIYFIYDKKLYSAAPDASRVNELGTAVEIWLGMVEI